MTKTMSYHAWASPKPLTAKSEVSASNTSPMPPLSSPSDAPSPKSEVLGTPEPELQPPARAPIRLDMRKAAEGRKVLAALTNINYRFKARLAADPYPISRMRSTANPNGFMDPKRITWAKSCVPPNGPPMKTMTETMINRVDAVCNLLESTDLVDAPGATHPVDVPSVANTAMLSAPKNRHRISAVTKAMRRSMFKVSVAKRGRNAGKYTMADKMAVAKSFVSMHHSSVD